MLPSNTAPNHLARPKSSLWGLLLIALADSPLKL